MQGYSNYTVQARKHNGKYLQPSKKNLRILRKAFPEVTFWKYEIKSNELPNIYIIMTNIDHNERYELEQAIDKLAKLI